MNLAKALLAELRKLRRSRAVLATSLLWLSVGSIAAFFIWIVRNPGAAESLGLVGRKVNFAVGDLPSDWTGLMAFIEQLAGMGGLILFSLIVAWIFGREYAEGTAKYLLASPVPRRWFVVAKLAVASVWYLYLSALLLGETLAMGTALGLPGFDAARFAGSAARILVGASATLLLGPAVAVAAVAGRGFIAPFVYTLGTMVAGTVFGQTDWAPWVPWSMVPLFSGAAGPGADRVGVGSLIALGGFGLVTLAGAIVLIERMDNAQ